uniref:Uncharacterized protein n=1 Tax=Globisporangium ultimum (strain ATCC 200006 / CBS 805.95 / DAOM BR144) TaxID=431595 RepID=K3W9H8_GLOUD
MEDDTTTFSPALELDHAHEHTLQNVLAFIDSFEDASSPSGDAPEGVAAARRSPKSLKPSTLKRNRHREKVKRELVSLRTHADELETQLKVVRHQQTTKALAIEGKADVMWKRVMSSEVKARHRVEAENQQLKAELLAHAEMAGRVMNAFNAVQEVAKTEVEMLPTASRSSAPLMDEDDVIAALVADLDPTFARLDAVFQANKWLTTSAPPTRSARHIEMKELVSAEGAKSPPVAELTDITTTPFRPRMTGKIMWRRLQQQYTNGLRDDINIEKTWHTENTIAVKFTDQYNFPSSATGRAESVTLNTRLVVRKYPHANSKLGMMMVWRAYDESETTPAEVYVEEFGWAAVEGVRRGSVIRQCVHVVQHGRADGMTTHHASEPTLLTDAALRANEVDFMAMSTAMENLRIVGDPVTNAEYTV